MVSKSIGQDSQGLKMNKSKVSVSKVIVQESLGP